MRLIRRLADPLVRRGRRWLASIVDEALARERGEHAARLQALERRLRDATAALGFAMERREARLSESAATILRRLDRLEDRADRPPIQDMDRPLKIPGRHVVFWGGDPAVSETACWLDDLQYDLDRLSYATYEAKRLRIDRKAYSAGKLAETGSLILPRSRYVEVLQGGTRSVEVHRQKDLRQLKASLDQNGRDDVLLVAMIFAASDWNDKESLLSDLTSASVWVFNHPDDWQRFQQTCIGLAEAGQDRDIKFFSNRSAEPGPGRALAYLQFMSRTLRDHVAE